MFVVRYLSQRIVEDLLMTDSPGGIAFFVCMFVIVCLLTIQFNDHTLV